MNWHLVWIAILAPALGFEVWALTHHRPATLSRTVWNGLRAWWFRAALFVFGGWLAYHWVVEHLWLRAGRPYAWDDWTVVAVFAVAGIAVRPKRATRQPEDTR